jgi:hypothetical protein
VTIKAGRTFFRPAWNKGTESLLSPLKLMQLKIGGDIHEARRSGIWLPAWWLAHSQPGREVTHLAAPRSKKSRSEAVAVRLSEMQKSIQARQQQIQRWVEQVKSRDSQILDQQQMNQVRSSASQAPQAIEAATSQSTQEEQNITAIRSDVKPYDGSREKVNRGRIQWGRQSSYVDRQYLVGAGRRAVRAGCNDPQFVPLLRTVACASLTLAIALSFCAGVGTFYCPREFGSE